MAFTFNGLILQSLMWPNNMAALGWAPWVIGATEMAWSRGGRAVFTAAMCGALQMLTGAPEIIFLTWIFIGGLLASRLVKGSHAESADGPWSPVLLVRRLALVIVLVAGVAAAQLLPFRDLLEHSHRDALPNSAGWAMPSWGWANLLLPLFRMREGYFGVPVQPGQYWTSSYYLGIGVTALALWTGVSVRHWRVRLLSTAAVLGFLLALGENGVIYPVLKHLIPAVGVMRYPIKCVVLTTLAAPLLAAFGVAAWSTHRFSTVLFPERKLLWIILGLGILTVVLIGSGYSAAAAGTTQFAQHGLIQIGILALTGGGVYWVKRLTQAKAQACVWATLPILICLDGLTHSPRLSPTAARWIYDAHAVDRFLPKDPRPRLGESRAMVSPHADHELQFSSISDPAQNHLSRRASLFNNLNLLEEIPKVNGMYSLYPKHEAEVLTRIYNCPDSYPGPLADFLGVSQVSARTNLFGWEVRRTALPLVTGGQQPVFTNSLAVLDQLESETFNSQASVFLDPTLRAALSGIRPSAVHIQPGTFTAGTISFGVTSADRALVVVAQTYYHWWTCSIDRHPAPLYEANHAFQGLVVPAGQHQVELRYVDRSFQVGCIVSGIFLLICAAGWILAPASRPSLDRQQPTTLA
jgi:hypothetical protein